MHNNQTSARSRHKINIAKQFDHLIKFVDLIEPILIKAQNKILTSGFSIIVWYSTK